MAEKQFNTRIINKHDTAENWAKAINFIPKKGELIVYDADENCDYSRMKIGDGITAITELNFIKTEADWSENDPEAASYVKNRTHWEIPSTYVEFLPETSLYVTVEEDTNDRIGAITTPLSASIVAGDTYTINWNGIVYECIATEVDGVPQFGRASSEEGDEPFLIKVFTFEGIDADGNAATYYGFVDIHDESETVTLSITQGEKGEIHKIDPKFLPEGIGYEIEGGIPPVVILPETTCEITDDDDGDGVPDIFGTATPLNASLVIGETYSVTYNGTAYECVAWESPALDGNGTTTVGLGNSGSFDLEDTGEPFVLLDFTEFSGGEIAVYGAMTDGATSVTLSISQTGGTSIHKIDPKYLPEGIGYEIESGGEILPETVLEMDGTAGYLLVRPTSDIVAGQTYTVIYNETAYECIAQEYSEDGLTVLVMGNIDAMTETGDNGMPFAFIYAPNNEMGEGVYGLTWALDGATSITLSIAQGGGIHKIDPKYLPEGIGYETEGTYKEIISESPIASGMDGSYVTVPFTNHLELGKEYTITINGTTYTSTATNVTWGSNTYVGLGGIPVSEEDFPFVVFEFPEPAYNVSDNSLGTIETAYGMAMAVGMSIGYDSTVHVYSGEKEKIHTIPQKYLPEYIYGQISEDKIYLQEITLDTSNSLANITTPFTNPIVVGDTYTVTYNGTEYELTAFESAYLLTQGMPSLGSLSDGDYPFQLSYKPDPTADDEGVTAYGLLWVHDGSTSSIISVKQGGEIRKIPSKFLPDEVVTDTSNLVPVARTINGKALSTNITLSASDVGADASGSANTALTNAKSYTDTAIANKVDKVSGKGLSTNDYTTDEKNKLAGVAEGANAYTHPTYTSKTSGLYKVTVDDTGHISAATAVTKDDIIALGIPAEDTKVTVDSALSSTSTNPVQNKVVNTAISDIQTQVDEIEISIPTKGVHYWTEADQEAIVQQVIAALGTPVWGQVDANNNIILTGDLPNGEYTFKYEDEEGNVMDIGVVSIGGVAYVNVLPQAINSDKTPFNGGQGWKTGYRLNSSGEERELADIEVTGFMPAKAGDTVYLKNVALNPTNPGMDAGQMYVWCYDANFTPLAYFSAYNVTTGTINKDFLVDSNGAIAQFVVSTNFFYYPYNSGSVANTAYIRLCCADISSNSIITVNQPIE